MTEANGQVGLLGAALDAAGGTDRWRRHNWVVEAGRILAEPNKADEEAWCAEPRTSAEPKRRVAD